MLIGPLKPGQDDEEKPLKVKGAEAHNQKIAHAFKFVRVDQVPAGAFESLPPSFGRIEAVWRRCTPSGGGASSLFLWQGSSSSASAESKEGAAALKAALGSTPTSLPVLDAGKYWEEHEEIGRAHIRYTSEFGLAVRGLLPAQDANENERPSSC